MVQVSLHEYHSDILLRPSRSESNLGLELDVDGIADAVGDPAGDVDDEGEPGGVVVAGAASLAADVGGAPGEDVVEGVAGDGAGGALVAGAADERARPAVLDHDGAEVAAAVLLAALRVAQSADVLHRLVSGALRRGRPVGVAPQSARPARHGHHQHHHPHHHPLCHLH